MPALSRDFSQQNANPSGQGLLNSGAERSEALAARGGGAPRRVAGVGPRDANQVMLIQPLTRPHCTHMIPTDMKVRGALWWDFDGTLVSRPVMWAEVAMRLLDRCSPGHGVTRDVMDAQVSQGMPWHRVDHAHPELSTPALWWEAVSHRYVEILEALGLPGLATTAAFEELRSDILDAERYVVFDDVVPALRRAAARGWRSLIVSNHVPELESLVNALGLTPFFESIVGSAVVGYEKPHPLLFEEALRRTGADRPIWMIGDNANADCAPVCGMGHNAVLVRSTAIGTFERHAEDLLGALDLIDSCCTR